MNSLRSIVFGKDCLRMVEFSLREDDPYLYLEALIACVLRQLVRLRVAQASGQLLLRPDRSHAFRETS